MSQQAYQNVWLDAHLDKPCGELIVQVLVEFSNSSLIKTKHI